MFRQYNQINYLLKARFHLQNKNYAKEVKFGQDVKRLLLQGVDKIVNAASVTLGPKGRNVIFENNENVLVTKDGATVAKTIDLEDRYENMGVKIIQGVAKNTNKRAGDGTTTAMVLAQQIAREGFDRLSRGSNPIEIRNGLMKGLNCALLLLDKITKPVTTRADIKNVATISANGDKEVGELIALALEKVGKEGVVTVKEGKTMKDSLEIFDGIKIENGYVSQSFVNSKGNKIIFENSLVLLCDMKITSVRQVISALEAAATSRKPIVIVAEDFEEEPIYAMILNKLKGACQVAAVKSPGLGDYRRELLQDMAVTLGGRVYGDEALHDKEEKINNIYFGTAGEVIISKDEAIFLKCQGKKEAIEERADTIRGLMDQVNNDLDLSKLKERLSRLLKGVAVLQIGANSEAELKEKKDRVDDALNATKAALEEGIVPGGGVALLRCIQELDKVRTDNADEKAGLEILAKALRIPCMMIASNAGVDASVVVDKVIELGPDMGYDARNNRYVNMMESGIIDPTKVVKTALEDAAAAASLLTTAEAAVTFVFDGDEIVLR